MNLRRWICLLLLLVAPLQLAWGAVSVYCQHETSAAAKHVGHHVHQHEGTSGADSSPGEPSKSAGVDLDCAGCHLSCTPLLPSGTMVNVLLSARAELLEVSSRHASIAYPPPDRPQWRFSA